MLTLLASIEEFLERDEYGLIAITCIDKLGTPDDASTVASLLRVLKAHLGERGAVLVTATAQTWMQTIPRPIAACFDLYEASYTTE